LIPRPLYMDRLREFIGKPVIKVITGIRRCGKSAVLELLRGELLKAGIGPDEIIFINFESFEFSDIRRADQLYAHVKERRAGREGTCCILLDEIQEVSSWEKAVNAFLVDFGADVYITGSNSRLLSSELATYLAGRYVGIHVQPLSFSEYLDFQQSVQGQAATDLRRAFGEYLRLGGFPVIHANALPADSAQKVVYDIYSSAILRDTVQRCNIRDIGLLERVVRFVLDNTGSKFSAKNVADYFKSQQRKVDLNTVYNYLDALEAAFIVYRIPRYDVRGREILRTQEKFYPADHSLIYAVMGYRDRFISGVLENIVMLELMRRGYRVFTGKLDDLEIDFIGECREQKVYVQVAFHLHEKTTIDREFAPLLKVRDHYPKYVVSMDEMWQDNVEGIRHIHIAEWLMKNEF